MSNENHYECGEMGPFWVIIQDDWNRPGYLSVRVLRGDWDVINPFYLPLESNLDFVRAKARLACKKLLNQWMRDVEAVDARRPL